MSPVKSQAAGTGTARAHTFGVVLVTRLVQDLRATGQVSSAQLSSAQVRSGEPGPSCNGGQCKGLDKPNLSSRAPLRTLLDSGALSEHRNPTARHVGGGWSIGARSLGWSPLLTHLLSTRIDLKREAEGRVPTAQIIIKLDAYRESSDGMLWPLRVVCTASNAAALCTAAVARVSEMRKSMVTRRRVCLTAAAARSSSSVKSKNDRPSGIGNPSGFSHKLEAHNEHLVSPPVDLHTEEFRTLGSAPARTTCVDHMCGSRVHLSNRELEPK